MADMDYSKPPYAYRLQAIHPDKPGSFGLSTACVMSCDVTGKMLSGNGGGSFHISPEVFEVLMNDREVRELIKKKLDAAPVA